MVPQRFCSAAISRVRLAANHTFLVMLKLLEATLRLMLTDMEELDSSKFTQSDMGNLVASCSCVQKCMGPSLQRQKQRWLQWQFTCLQEMAFQIQCEGPVQRCYVGQIWQLIEQINRWHCDRESLELLDDGVVLGLQPDIAVCRGHGLKHTSDFSEIKPRRNTRQEDPTEPQIDASLELAINELLRAVAELSPESKTVPPAKLRRKIATATNDALQWHKLKGTQDSIQHMDYNDLGTFLHFFLKVHQDIRKWSLLLSVLVSRNRHGKKPKLTLKV